ncbi:class I SAM-dependent methyltransferase [Paenibacillus oenotherae]|uniref:Class I SAM-dependent methyltransferase n=1 Tax=Paenibacillus oenotherae TaxID=1435645 RepID=A0ABS7D3V0_9BACL|nr:class I SAM-dependent methyltransferase [Paenibacillus oenotherae]MBW7474605.1 class I SAM-dependent methyltransferase [Paenibacillus oenotherae]
MKLKDYTEQNRAAWNEVTPKHLEARGEIQREKFSARDDIALDDIVVNKLLEFGIKDKRVAQLCCNTGIETLSLKKLGAAQCVGFDISDAAIEEAVSLSEHLGIPAAFVRTDIYEIPDSYYGQFDIVYISVGTLGWMPDLDRFFLKVTDLLAEGGSIFMYEMHPIIDMFDEKDKTIVNSYFKATPFIDNGGLDYVGGVQYEGQTQYWFPHTMSGIIQSMINYGAQIRYFQEYPHDISNVAGHLESESAPLPLSYILIGSK